ncbi:MAG TPA: GlpM family protein [Haliangium sp.]|nr:GlpM family protein [Haliangium sp.]
MTALALKAAIGALVVIIIALVSKSKSFYIAGMVPLFPSFALIAHYIVGTERSPADLRTTALFGLWSLVPYAVYLAVVYVLSDRLALWATLSVATIAWFLAAGCLLALWLRFHPS